MPTVKTVHVRLDGRRFSVLFDEWGNATRIKERKKGGTPPIEYWYDLAYWSRRHHKANPGSLPYRIIEAAKNSAQGTEP